MENFEVDEKEQGEDQLKLNTERAEKEVKKWLDKKKVLLGTREAYKDHVKIMVDAFAEGVLQLNEDNTITHELLFPFEQGKTHLTYRARVNDNDKTDWFKNVPDNDGELRVIALIACLTNTAKGLIAKLDSVDKRIASAISVFFM
jgi:hypothetical protein